MRNQGFLGIACVFLIAGAAISCWVGEVEVKPTGTTQDRGRALETRRAPLENRQVPLSPAAEASQSDRSEPAGVCDPGDSPVMIVVVESPRKVASAAALFKDTPILVQDPETVVFTDGRIVTSSIEATGDRLQSLGWAHRDIEIVSGLPAASGAWRRRRG